MSSEDSSSDCDLIALLANLDLYGLQDGGLGCDAWSQVLVDEYQTDVGIDNVDHYLLDIARKETEVVVKRMMTGMFGRRKKQNHNVKPEDTLCLFLMEPILDHMKRYINTSMVD